MKIDNLEKFFEEVYKEGFERRGNENNVANAFQVARRTGDGDLVSVDEHGLSVGRAGGAFYDTEAEAEAARQRFMQAREGEKFVVVNSNDDFRD